jgi:hypothetical protein
MKIVHYILVEWGKQRKRLGLTKFDIEPVLILRDITIKEVIKTNYFQERSQQMQPGSTVLSESEIRKEASKLLEILECYSLEIAINEFSKAHICWLIECDFQSMLEPGESHKEAKLRYLQGIDLDFQLA